MKIRFRGQKITVRLMTDEEIIRARCLFRERSCFDSDSSSIWRESNAQGDRVGEHPHREYVEIISSWFKL